MDYMKNDTQQGKNELKEHFFSTRWEIRVQKNSYKTPKRTSFPLTLTPKEETFTHKRQTNNFSNGALQRWNRNGKKKALSRQQMVHQNPQSLSKINQELLSF
jgi:hypothetical protein